MEGRRGRVLAVGATNLILFTIVAVCLQNAGDEQDSQFGVSAGCDVSLGRAGTRHRPCSCFKHGEKPKVENQRTCWRQSMPRQKPRDLRMEAAEHPRPKESESMHHITGGGDRKPSHFRTSTTTDAAQAAITVLQDQLRDVDQPETVKLAEAKHAVAVLHEQLAHLVATSKKLESG
eukprot:3345938-Rhodomonas_salina.1